MTTRPSDVRGMICGCGHLDRWHGHGGKGSCEHDGECGCERFHGPGSNIGAAVQTLENANIAAVAGIPSDAVWSVAKAVVKAYLTGEITEFRGGR